MPCPSASDAAMVVKGRLGALAVTWAGILDFHTSGSGHRTGLQERTSIWATCSKGASALFIRLTCLNSKRSGPFPVLGRQAMGNRAESGCSQTLSPLPKVRHSIEPVEELATFRCYLVPRDCPVPLGERKSGIPGDPP